MRVLTWGGGGGGGAEREFVAVGKETFKSVVRTFDGLEEDGGPLGIRFLLPLFLNCVNLLGEGINLSIQLSKLRVHRSGRSVSCFSMSAFVNNNVATEAVLYLLSVSFCLLGFGPPPTPLEPLYLAGLKAQKRR